MATKSPAASKSSATKQKPRKAKSEYGANGRALPVRVIRFCHEWVKHLNGTKAATDAGYSAKSANVTAAKLLANPNIAAYIAKLQAEVAETLKIDHEKIVDELHRVFTADANELTEFRRTCCRFCHGIDNKYQRTPNEMKQAREFHEKRKAEAIAMGIKEKVMPQSMKEFDEEGGIGYDPRKNPSLECPECFGEGIGDVFLKDTRELSKNAKALYAGVKRTKEGIEVMTHSKQGMGTLLMRHLGMLNDKLMHEGNPEKPVETRTRVVIVPTKNVASIGISQIKPNHE